MGKIKQISYAYEVRVRCSNKPSKMFIVAATEWDEAENIVKELPLFKLADRQGWRIGCYYKIDDIKCKKPCHNMLCDFHPDNFDPSVSFNTEKKCHSIFENELQLSDLDQGRLSL